MEIDSMSEKSANSADAAASYVDLAKWIVGLCAAVFAGFFLHPEHIVEWPLKARSVVAIVLFILGISIVSGILYPFWLNWMRRQREKLDEVEKELSITSDPSRRAELASRRAKLKDNIDKAGPARTNLVYKVFVYSFCVAAFVGVVGFCASIVALQKKKPDDPKPPVAVIDPLRFTVVQSAVHKTKSGMQAHTFLLNRQTGEIWQMVCDAQGNVVSFQRVERRDLNGNPEKDEAGTKEAGSEAQRDSLPPAGKMP
jgi:hypothetical protein